MSFLKKPPVEEKKPVPNGIEPKKDEKSIPKPISKKEEAAMVMPKPVSNQFEEIMRRLRLLEERYSGLRKKTQFTEK